MTGAGAALARLSDLERRLLELAESGEWEALAGSLPEHDALLANLDADDKARSLAAALGCTRRIEGLARAARAECAREIAALRTGARAAVSYVTVKKDFT